VRSPSLCGPSFCSPRFSSRTLCGLLVVFAAVFVARVFVAKLLVAFAGAFFVHVVDFVFLFMNEIFSKYISLSKKIF